MIESNQECMSVLLQVFSSLGMSWSTWFHMTHERLRRTASAERDRMSSWVNICYRHRHHHHRRLHHRSRGARDRSARRRSRSVPWEASCPPAIDCERSASRLQDRGLHRPGTFECFLPGGIFAKRVVGVGGDPLLGVTHHVDAIPRGEIEFKSWASCRNSTVRSNSSSVDEWQMVLQDRQFILAVRDARRPAWVADG